MANTIVFFGASYHFSFPLFWQIFRQGFCQHLFCFVVSFYRCQQWHLFRLVIFFQDDLRAKVFVWVLRIKLHQFLITFQWIWLRVVIWCHLSNFYLASKFQNFTATLSIIYQEQPTIFHFAIRIVQYYLVLASPFQNFVSSLFSVDLAHHTAFHSSICTIQYYSTLQLYSHTNISSHCPLLF